MVFWNMPISRALSTAVIWVVGACRLLAAGGRLPFLAPNSFWGLQAPPARARHPRRHATEGPKNCLNYPKTFRCGRWVAVEAPRLALTDQASTVMSARLRKRNQRKTGPAGEFPMDTAPATEAGTEADGEESSEAGTAKTAAQSGNDTEPISAMEAEAPDEGGASASAAAPASPVENTDGGNAPETDPRDETDSKKSDDSGSDESPKNSAPMTTPLPDFDSLNGNQVSVWEETGLWHCKMLVWDLTDLQQHAVYRRMVEIHMHGEGLKLEYIDTVNICLNYISQILNNLEVEGHAKGCGYCCKADKEFNLALYDALEGCDYQVYLPDDKPYCVRYPKTLHPLASVLLEHSSDPKKYKPRTIDGKVKYPKIALPTIWKILVSLHVFPATLV